MYEHPIISFIMVLFAIIVAPRVVISHTLCFFRDLFLEFEDTGLI
jgi:hypothetical protein